MKYPHMEVGYPLPLGLVEKLHEEAHRQDEDPDKLIGRLLDMSAAAAVGELEPLVQARPKPPAPDRERAMTLVDFLDGLDGISNEIMSDPMAATNLDQAIDKAKLVADHLDTLLRLAEM